MLLKPRIKACYVLLIALQTILFKNENTLQLAHSRLTNFKYKGHQSLSILFLELKEDAAGQSKESNLPAYLSC